MKPRVNEDHCPGCGPCEEICTDVFEVVDGVAKVKVDLVHPGVEDSCREAVENCPTEAISIEE